LLEEDTAFEPGSAVIVVIGGIERETEIEWFRRQHGRCVAKFKGIDDISVAERYIGGEVKIPAERLPAVQEGWFYTFQLKGCRVYTAQGEYIGDVTDVLGSGGNEILKVDRDKKETLIPFAQEYVKKIDPDQQRIEVDLPQELRDLNK
jgi:16S rRNA processing protein RimM